MKLLIKRGTTSKTVRIYIQDASQTTGAGLSGLAYSSTGLTAYYFRAGDTASTAITLASGTAGTWSSGGLSAVDATNMPGLYELGLPNAALSGSGESVIVYLKGAANMVPCLLEIELTSVDVQDGNAFGMAYLNESVSSISSSGFSTLTYGNFK